MNQIFLCYHWIAQQQVPEIVWKMKKIDQHQYKAAAFVGKKSIVKKKGQMRFTLPQVSSTQEPARLPLSCWDPGHRLTNATLDFYAVSFSLFDNILAIFQYTPYEE